MKRSLPVALAVAACSTCCVTRRGLGLGNLAAKASSAVPPVPPVPPVLPAPVVVSAGQDLGQTSLEDYAAMRDDAPRTEAYAAAINERLQGRSLVVADIGTGPFALLALLAARAGARHVYAIERTPSVAQKAQQAVRAAGLEDVITVITGTSQDVTLPERVDLVVSELVGNVATGEGVVDTIRDAKRRFLKRDATDATDATDAMIPARCQTAVAPVAYLNHELLAAKGPEFLRPFRLFAKSDLAFLSRPQLLEDFDLSDPDDLRQPATLEFQLDQSGPGFSGFALWPRVVVDARRTVDVLTAPSHWCFIVALMSPKRLPITQKAILHSSVDLSKVPYSYSLSADLV
ncbi:unnamed protein product [Effrenium voratum]|nr:unnamed protein product [Effrenium voratum]